MNCIIVLCITSLYPFVDFIYPSIYSFIYLSFYLFIIPAARNYVRAVSPYFQSLNSFDPVKSFDITQSITPVSRLKSLPISPNLMVDNMILKNVNNFDNLNNLDSNEIVQQIVNINENLVETAKIAISVSGLELSEKFNSIFHIDLTTFF